MHLDANNLYGRAMSQSLPAGGFNWLSEERNQQHQYQDDGEEGLISEVDLEHPKELHDFYNDYPLGAKKVTLTENGMS